MNENEMLQELTGEQKDFVAVIDTDGNVYNLEGLIVTECNAEENGCCIGDIWDELIEMSGILGECIERIEDLEADINKL